MMGGSGVVGNAITLNFAPTAAEGGGGSASGSVGGSDEFHAQVH